MPLYTYECAKHGSFDALATIAQRNDAKPCPECAVASSRPGVEGVQDSRHKGDPRAMSDAALTAVGR